MLKLYSTPFTVLVSLMSLGIKTCTMIFLNEYYYRAKCSRAVNISRLIKTNLATTAIAQLFDNSSVVLSKSKQLLISAFQV